jgi:chromosomal replication initiator protein
MVSLGVELTTKPGQALNPSRPAELTRPAEKPSLQGIYGQGGKYTRPFHEWNVFKNFVVGDSNKTAYECCQAFSKDDSIGNSLLLLQSGSGLGKTHLSQAVGSQAATNRKSVKYIWACDHSRHYVSSINKKDFDSYNNIYRNIDLFIIEDITFLERKKQFQIELCDDIDYLMDKGAKVIITSSRPISEIAYLSEGCRSRLNQALRANISPPSYETRLQILVNLVKAFSYKIPMEVLEELAETLTDDVRLLRSSVSSLWVKGAYEKRQVNRSMVKDYLSGNKISSPNGESLSVVKNLLMDSYKINEATLLSPNSTKTITELRSIAMYLSRRMTDHSLAEIGKAYNRSHCSVLYNFNKIDKDLGVNDKLTNKVEYFVTQLEKKGLKASINKVEKNTISRSLVS